MAAKKGLGRSFDSLIPTELLDESFDPTASQDDQISDLRYIKLTAIRADADQPRRHFDEAALAELAASVKEHGILQPIVVTVDGDGYKIVAGERRYRAATIAGLDKVPVLVRSLTDQHRLELSLIENIQRHDLSPIETATAYAKLRDQFNLSLEDIGHRVGGKSVSAISNTLRLLKLPHVAQKALADGTLREGQVRPLIGLDETVVQEIIPIIIKEGWSVRAVEQYVSQLKRDSKAQPNPTAKENAQPDWIGHASSHFTSTFSTQVSVRTNAQGAGKIVIAFKDHDDFERIQSLLDRQ